MTSRFDNLSLLDFSGKKTHQTVQRLKRNQTASNAEENPFNDYFWLPRELTRTSTRISYCTTSNLYKAILLAKLVRTHFPKWLSSSLCLNRVAVEHSLFKKNTKRNIKLQSGAISGFICRNHVKSEHERAVYQSRVCSKPRFKAIDMLNVWEHKKMVKPCQSGFFANRPLLSREPIIRLPSRIILNKIFICCKALKTKRTSVRFVKWILLNVSATTFEW